MLQRNKLRGGSMTGGKSSGEMAAGETRGLFTDLTDHPKRHQLVAEVHARPFPLMPAPRRILHFAFLVDGDEAEADREQIGDLLRAQGLQAASDAKYVSLDLGKVQLRWELHTEFVTYTFDTGAAAQEPFGQRSFADVLPEFSLKAPGALVVAVEVALVAERDGQAIFAEKFDVSRLSMSQVEEGAALIGTDFTADAAGTTRILVVDRELGPVRAGGLVQRLLEIETYRIFALLALPEVQRLSPEIGRIERGLTDIVTSIRLAEGLDANRILLNDLTSLAADLQAHTASISYRLGATRAYHTIFDQRLQALGEKHVTGFSSLLGFLMRRMNPAMRTCYAFEAREKDLADKLSGAANLLRTRVDIELEQQNRRLLESMNRRARLQLRLQQTVEGLSVAAISYYIVGLISYMGKGVRLFGAELPVGLVEAVSVPFVVLAIWFIVRRIRRGHSGD